MGEDVLGLTGGDASLLARVYAAMNTGQSKSTSKKSEPPFSICRQPKCWDQPYGGSEFCLAHQLGSRETYVLARWYELDAATRRFVPSSPDEPPELVRACIGVKRTTVWLPRGARIVLRHGINWSPYGTHYYGRDRITRRPWHKIEFEIVI